MWFSQSMFSGFWVWTLMSPNSYKMCYFEVKWVQSQWSSRQEETPQRGLQSSQRDKGTHCALISLSWQQKLSYLLVSGYKSCIELFRRIPIFTHLKFVDNIIKIIKKCVTLGSNGFILIVDGYSARKYSPKVVQDYRGPSCWPKLPVLLYMGASEHGRPLFFPD